MEIWHEYGAIKNIIWIIKYPGILYEYEDSQEIYYENEYTQEM